MVEKVIRYAVRMKNGSYMRQEFDDRNVSRVLIHTVDHPIDASLLKDRVTAQRCIDDVISGNTNLLCLYDDNNPPEEVVELFIEVEF